MAAVVDEPAFRNRVHVFDDRGHAGALLADKLGEYQGAAETYVLAIPAGGVPVAVEVSQRLGLPLDLAVTRKLHVPWNQEAGFGAVSWDGGVFLNEALVASLGLSAAEVARCVAAEQRVMARRVQLFRGDRPFPELQGRRVIVVDDGLASGFSMLATVKAMAQRGVGAVVVAVPTAPVRAVELIRSHVDQVVCLNLRSGPVFAVADAYRVWSDVEETAVVAMLRQAWTARLSP